MPPRSSITLVFLCVLLACLPAHGQGSGAPRFDDATLRDAGLSHASVKITREPLLAGEISPLQYGQFIEYLCDLVPAMWSEKLYDGSFEGLSPYQFEFIKETDFKEKAWYPSGEVNRANFSLDPGTKVSGKVSKKIEVEPGPRCRVGISQDGIFVERGQKYEFKIWLRASRPNGLVRVTLHLEAEVYAACEFHPTADWGKFSAQLAASARDANATLSIEFQGPGTLWLDNASLMPMDAVGGWRRDVVEAVRALKPGIIRFGGNTVDPGDFDWKDTIGEPDHRRPFRAWGGLQPAGPGLEEIVQFCRVTGAEPLICARFSKRNPSDAAEEVEYFNGSTNTPMGQWRARNGHPSPYRIKYWQIGNERGGPDYEERVAAFCEAMKKADPSIRLCSSFPTPAVLRNAGGMLDYACPHHYSQDLGWMERNLEQVGRMIRENAPGRDIKIAVTEWNTTAGDAGPRRAMLWSLANALACSRYHNLLHRHCDVVEIANRSNLANSFCSGIIQTDNHRLFKTPTYYAQQLYATLAGNNPLRLESAAPPNAGLDLSATLSAKGDEVTLFAINDGLDELVRPLDFSAFGARAQRISVWTLTDQKRLGEPDAANSFSEPERIAPTHSYFKARSPRFDYRFPALSLTVMKWKAE